jgi:metal-responsive CopG/Arc/MetJ family transcriptional regulator
MEACCTACTAEARWFPDTCYGPPSSLESSSCSWGCSHILLQARRPWNVISVARERFASISPSKQRYTRASFSVPTRLLADLDDLTTKMGYQERSKALEAAIRAFVDESRIAGSSRAYANGTVLILFDDAKRGVEVVTQVVRQFGPLVVSTLSIHLPEPNYLYVTVVRGKVADIVELERHLQKLDGVKQLRVSYLMTEPNERASPS